VVLAVAPTQVSKSKGIPKGVPFLRNHMHILSENE